MSPYIIPGIEKAKPFKPSYLLLLVCNYFEVPVSEVISKNRQRIFTNPRFVAMYLMRTQLKMTFPQIAGMFNRNHSAVIRAVEIVKGLIKIDENYLQVITMVNNYLRLHDQRRAKMFRPLTTTNPQKGGQR